VADTVTVRGSGGFVFDMDLPDPGTNARENVDQQLAKGLLTVVEAPPAAVRQSKPETKKQ